VSVSRQEQKKSLLTGSECAPALAESLHDRVSRLSRQLRSIELPSGMTQERMSVLAIVDTRGPISVSALAHHERVRPATMSRMVSALEADGFVERISNEKDGRGVLVALTPSGREAFTAARAQRLAQFSVALNSLSREQLRSMGELASVLENITRLLENPQD
jgi:DNA-binding MarR family transcriptional regulator